MDIIKIKSPTCGKILRLNNAPNINAASFTCPVCKEKHIVGQCQRYVPPTNSCEETQYGNTGSPQSNGEETRTCFGQAPSGGEGETQIGPAPGAVIGRLIDTMGRSYQLRQGTNTIGRKATTSTASIQVETADRTMSRSHAIIEVFSQSGRIVHLLKNGENKNPSYLNGSLIDKFDQLILKDGDRIKMGGTELTFRI